MTTKTYLVEMPGDWEPNKIGEYNCHKCPVYGSCGIKDDDCPLANAKEAVSVDVEYAPELEDFTVTGKNGRIFLKSQGVAFYVVENETNGK